MIQRFIDWRHERYIRRMRDRTHAAIASSDRAMVKMYWGLLKSAVLSRSPAQIRRMDERLVRGMDETSRRVFEKHRVRQDGI